MGAYHRSDRNRLDADFDRAVRDVPAPGRAARPARRLDVGRRAADAGDRARPDRETEMPAARRADARPGADHRRRDQPHRPRPGRERHDDPAGGAECGDGARHRRPRLRARDRTRLRSKAAAPTSPATRRCGATTSAASRSFSGRPSQEFRHGQRPHPVAGRRSTSAKAASSRSGRSRRPTRSRSGAASRPSRPKPARRCAATCATSRTCSSPGSATWSAKPGSSTPSPTCTGPTCSAGRRTSSSRRSTTRPSSPGTRTRPTGA